MISLNIQSWGLNVNLIANYSDFSNGNQGRSGSDPWRRRFERVENEKGSQERGGLESSPC